MIELRRLKPDDADLDAIATRLSSPNWEGSIGGFSAAALTTFLREDSRIYLLAYWDGELAGAAHAYLLQHPAGSLYLYIDEVDTLPAYRRRGVATALMRELLSLADRHGAAEAWLGADAGNAAAYALYRKLGPDEEKPGAVFTYEVKEAR